MLRPAASYETLSQEFAWNIPQHYNIGLDACDRWANSEPDRTAIIDLSQGQNKIVSFQKLKEVSDQIATLLSIKGAIRGDRIAVFRGQSMLTAAAHLAILKLGCISVPLFPLFRREALISRLSDSSAKLIFTAPDTVDEIDAILPELPALDASITLEDSALPDSFFKYAETKATDPAILIYTSGTTGAPKGALLPHQVLLGHLPGVELSHDFLGQPDDCIWTPADWAWIGGLLDVLLPALQLGVPVVASPITKFNPEACKELIEKNKIRNVFFPPTALKLLKAHNVQISGLRSVASGGEPLGTELLDWGRSAFGLTINEFYGQTECNMVVSSCASLFTPPSGAMGKPVVGHQLRVINDAGQPTDQEGDIAIKRGTPVMMLNYWNNPHATKEKFRGDWLLTGDKGILRDGYIFFIGRSDDVITSAGYRIGPAGIENCLLSHPAVVAAGVVGKPDPIRTEIVKAYVQLKPKTVETRTLKAELQDHVKKQLSAHEYPREISFVDSLPMTVTSKIIRKELKARAAAEAMAEI